MLWSSVFSFCHRLLCFVGYGYAAYLTLTLCPSGVPLRDNVIHVTKYLTNITLLLQILYYALAIILPSKCGKFKSSMACLSLTASASVSVVFWALYFIDASLVIREEYLKIYPRWHMHVTHSLMTISILFDIICSRLPRVPFIKTLFLVFGYFGGYAAYTEFLITKQNFYTYPILRNFDVRGRYYFYAVNLSVVLIVFLLSVMIIRVGSTEQKRKTKKDKTKNKKNQQPPKQTRAVPTVAKPSKSRKQD
uniref:TLC domain-containing protein n=1 Tax=Mesocestoides corti TaxID=53468 RepID=A0A5K3EVT7_MESCO